MEFSSFTKRFTRESGIVQLMEDLGDAMSSDERIFMLGGGNPAHIPEVEKYFHERMKWFIDNPGEFARTIGDYDSPRGEKRFIQALVDFFKVNYQWNIKPENVVLSTGSQSGFFMLFNTFAGQFPEARHKKILFPMVPEYIGYTDVGLSENMFIANKPVIETSSDHTFKYFIDFDGLKIDEEIGAVCISRPTNPTGNVITDDELTKLHEIVREHDIPLIVDNAYGMPFPNIIFTDVHLDWSENIIFCMSLSKLGLPAVRTGIIIAREDIAEAVSRMNAIINLALGSFGPALVLDMVKTGRIRELCSEIITPFYRRKAERAIQLFHRELAGIDYYIHRSEGAIFLWIWFPGLPVSCVELYRRLKKRGVLVLSGHYFFPGYENDWRHKHECIRVSYAMDDAMVSEGIKIISEEVREIYSNR